MPVKRLLFVLLLLMLALPLPALAQDEDIPPLTETFVAQDESFQFNYPADWEIPVGEGDAAVIMTAPIAGEGQTPMENVVTSQEALSIFFTIVEAEGATAEEVALNEAETLLGDGGDMFEVGTVLSQRIAGRPAAQITSEFGISYARHIVVDFGNEVFFTVWMTGLREQFAIATPIVYEIIRTVEMPGYEVVEAESDETTEPLPPAEELTEKSSTVEGLVVFSYPAGWELSEGSNYSLLVAPDGFEIGISGRLVSEFGFPDDSIPPEVAYIQLVVDSINANSEEEVVSYDDIQILTLNGRPAARVEISAPDFYYSSFAILLEDDETLASVSVVATPELIETNAGTLFAVVESLEVAD